MSYRFDQTVGTGVTSSETKEPLSFYLSLRSKPVKWIVSTYVMRHAKAEALRL